MGRVGKTEILVATTNAGKLREIRRILHDTPVSLRTLDDFPHVEIPEETGATFAENARQKALHYAGVTGMLTMAEDSGFEVDALNGEPGIYSARYLREDATYDQRFADIYRRARESGSTDRSARFVCALAVAHRGDVRVRDSCDSGRIARRETRRSKRFRVRPDFLVSGLRQDVRRSVRRREDCSEPPRASHARISGVFGPLVRPAACILPSYGHHRQQLLLDR